MEKLTVFNIFSSFVFLFSIQLSKAADTITPASSFIRDGEKFVSSSERFELGFFSPRKSRYRYLGIWYKQIPDTVVWVANRNSPIIEPNAALTISNNGNLVILNLTNGAIWSSNTSRKAENPVAQLLDTGNLIVRDNFSRSASEGSCLWQSFDYPSDTLLAGMKLGWDLKNGVERYLTSWRSADDPSPGNITNRLDIHVLPELGLYNGSQKLSRSGPWNGIFFGAAPSYASILSEPILVDNEDEIYYSYESYNNPIIAILTVNPSGTVQRLIWHERSNGWAAVHLAPTLFCQFYGHCGGNRVCSYEKTPNCECLKGFKPKSQHNQTRPGSCVRSESADCKSGDRFIMVDDIKLPDLLNVSLNKSMNLKECEAECLKNRTCRAYANSEVTGRGSGCLMWAREAILVICPSFSSGGASYYFMHILSMETKTQGKRANEFCKGDKTGSRKSRDSLLPFFSLASVSAATNNFGVENKLGEGGFGPVYKSGQGLEEFKNEIKLTAKLQHRNLVRLLGCCVEQGENVLIYEYLPNKSLDSFLFDTTKEGLLGWGARIRIIEGIAQGLLYLHQYSRLRVIHRDLKPSNILLDSNMIPKISDFGLARMFGGDELQSNTKRIVGTYGYMSPEYAIHGFFSIKSDVFSFGVLLLETLSSKRSTRFFNTNSLTLLGHAWNLWKDDRSWELMDPKLQCEASYPIVKRYINVALLCVQENAADRPTMSEVISMLTNEFVNLPSPQQPGFSSLKKSVETVARSMNRLTLSVMDAR
ncbi:G-type lectin S-receptor-like serine/threonine-protein kinase [Citrus sinensis]|uniref:G-type lectin S-receptor-like serine/threonine-protein kinase n=2 Tax=Citrus sinensis TaxID=2711 RepID=A0ACB8NYL7_CITSI|nr:G-type lectin S-receptor-like serine/threonine-protein kinase [Citrus sinensis]KAH9802961.1 G-type lectin S-receptor-like serine/threonine-protein kinase [Citrus sinensis]